jgi:hypothetical protein
MIASYLVATDFVLSAMDALGYLAFVTSLRYLAFDTWDKGRRRRVRLFLEMRNDKQAARDSNNVFN